MIITLTTDFGLKDPFVGAMKGVILGLAPDVQIVDITHDIPSYDITEASIVVHEACRYFPAGSIHNAVITSVMSYGAFARIEAGVEGLIHASEMVLEPNQTPRDILFEGQELKTRILHVDPAHQRMGLSLLLQTPS